MSPLLRVEDMVKRYRRPGLAGLLRTRAPAAVDRVSLTVEPGESVGLIGESGSGKTTLVRAALGLLPFEQGEVQLLGSSLHGLSGAELRGLRQRCQLLLQDPDASLNPGLTVRAHLLESARLHQPGADPGAAAQHAAERVGIEHRLHGAPHELSGGEKRRVGIARLLLADPQLTVADEPTAGLDAALKAEIMDLLLATRGPDRSHLFISHDIQLICYACDRIAVMLSGLLVEEVPVRSLGQAVHHPYTSSLLAAAGVTDRAAEALPEPPPVRGAPGCPYHGPCPHSTPRCATRRPELQPPPGGIREPRHRLACHVLAPGGQP